MREKTGGNPFFVIQFLTALHRQGLITFDRDARAAGAGTRRASAREGYTDNVVELVVGKLRELPPETQEALTLAACLGATSNAERSPSSSGAIPTSALHAALEEDLLLRIEDAYRFPHDRVQEAAYSLIPESDRADGASRHRPTAPGANAACRARGEIFDIVNQLNLGAALITSREERERIAELNLMAGKRAQRSTAYASALRYFTAGASS